MTDQRLSSEQLDPEIDEITEEMDDLIQKRTRLLKKLVLATERSPMAKS